MEIVVSADHSKSVGSTFVADLVGRNAHLGGEETEKDGGVVQIVNIARVRVGNVFHCILQHIQVFCREVIPGENGIPTPSRSYAFTHHTAALVLRNGLRSVRLNVE